MTGRTNHPKTDVSISLSRASAVSSMMDLNIGKPPALYRAAFYPVAVPLSIRNADFYRGNNIYIKSGEIGISEERGIYYAPLFFLYIFIPIKQYDNRA